MQSQKTEMGFLPYPKDEEERKKILKELIKAAKKHPDYSEATKKLKEALEFYPGSTQRKNKIKELYAKLNLEWFEDTEGTLSQDEFFLVHATQQSNSFWWDYG